MSSPGYFIRPAARQPKPPTCPNHPDKAMREAADRVWMCDAFECRIQFNGRPNQTKRSRKA